MGRKPTLATSVSSFGTAGAMIVADSNSDLPARAAKAVQVTDVTGGNVLQVLPFDNSDGDWITYTGVVVGFTPLFQVRRVGAATTCACVAVLG